MYWALCILLPVQGRDGPGEGGGGGGGGNSRIKCPDVRVCLCVCLYVCICPSLCLSPCLSLCLSTFTHPNLATSSECYPSEAALKSGLWVPLLQIGTSSHRCGHRPCGVKTTCKKHDLVQSGKSSLMSWPDVKVIPQTNKQTNFGFILM